MDDRATSSPDVRVVLISLDRQLEAAALRAEKSLRKAVPGLTLSFHAAADWARDPASLDACRAEIDRADLIIASMLFMEDHINAVLPNLQDRRESCDAIAGCMSAAEVVKLTKLGRFRMDKPESGPIALLKRLRGSSDKSKAGASQIKMLRRLPKLLRYIPGTAQDVRAYFLTLQYWLAGSDTNIERLVRFLLNRYASGPRESLRGALPADAPEESPDVGVYHPRMTPRLTESAAKLPFARSRRPTVGLLIMRSYALSGDTGHYDGVIDAMEQRGLRVIPAFASGLDAREAVERHFMKDGAAKIDALVSLTGFSLVGGPAYNDAGAAAEMLDTLDVPYLSAQALEFQSLQDWGAGAQGLTPVETTMMVAIPEIDGSTGPIVYGARANGADACTGCARGCTFEAGEQTGALRMQSCPERADMLARRVEKLISLRQKPVAERKIAISLFNFPPNGGAVGTAAYLSVFDSLFNTLKGLKSSGYNVDVPTDVDALRTAILQGNAAQHGTDANVHAKVSANQHVARETRLADIEAQWGPAPGKSLSDGRNIHILGAQFGSVFVGLQPPFGYEGDPMRLLFESSFAPTHAFAAYYRWLREEFATDAHLHFGTHGALEFMPGKHVGMTADCWPDYLIGATPNVYLYAANNPSEASIAKRRSAAVTISHRTPSLTEAGLYKTLSGLRDSLNAWRAAPEDGRTDLEALITEQAAAAEFDLDLADMDGLRAALDEIEQALIPEGLHIVGAMMDDTARADLLDTIAADDAERRAHLDAALQEETEIPALIRALGGGFTPPVAGGDLLRNPDMLPTGRNIHGFDPYRMPSALAVADGARQAERVLDRHIADAGALPETVAMVLWGADNLKSEGAQIAQALALMGAEPRFDSYGRLSGADLIPLDALSRPRIDVVATLSGIFRDLLPLQSRMLAEAAYAAACADEPLEQNFIRKHALAYQAEHGCDLETAALRVFSNAEGAYGSNVNQLIDAGCWEDGDDLADAYETRKCFAYGRSGSPAAQPGLLNSILGDVDLSYQNLESVELGLTTIDHYFDTLGGISRAVKRAKGSDAPVYIGDQTTSDGVVRTLTEQVALETRTRTLNPKWYEGMLRHGYEGVRQIEAHVANTMGWSATTGEVPAWVYQGIGETFVLDTELRDRLAELNPKSCANLANRLLEACDRNLWSPDEDTLAALRQAGEDLEDRVEGVGLAEGAAA
ncbi:MAG: cobaltochelatase subunit CobN [Pseudomonadota bacterium]